MGCWKKRLVEARYGVGRFQDRPTAAWSKVLLPNGLLETHFPELVQSEIFDPFVLLLTALTLFEYYLYFTSADLLLGSLVVRRLLGSEVINKQLCDTHSTTPSKK
jgi:hypothetical protein